jgi:hypothetical protein
LTRALFQARQVSQRLAGIRLNRQLGRRPSVGELVERGVLPTDCFVLVPNRRSLDTASLASNQGPPKLERQLGKRKEEWVRTTISPQVIATRQSLERERLKDRLRSFLSGKGRAEMERRIKEQRAREQDGVRVLVRRFARRDKGEVNAPMYGTGTLGKKGIGNRPARAHVLGMRRFWESKNRGVVGGRDV